VSGFGGLVRLDGAPVDDTVLAAMADELSCCGPDGSGTWSDGPAGLTHALLSFSADSPDEPQPATLDGRRRLVADARLDGRAELARELRSHGIEARPETADAELLLHAYAVWGERCPEHLLGDFAFAIWDPERRSLFCARDHFGVVPFYYSETADAFLFANVLRALRRHPGVSETLDERAIGDFLLFGLNLDPATTSFADIRSLPPGHSLVLDERGLRIRRYWEPDTAPPTLRLPSQRDYVDRFRETFDRAVADRLRTTSVATHLSGGMDSTSIAASAREVLAARGESFDLRAYTIVYERLVDEEEGHYAALVARRLGIPWERVVAEEHVGRPQATSNGWATPEPSVDLQRSAGLEIARRTAAFSRTLLAGIGGDPLFHVRPSRPRSAAEWSDLLRYSSLRLRHGHVPHLGVRTALRRATRGSRPVSPELPSWLAADFARRAGLAERLHAVLAVRTASDAYGGLLGSAWPALFAWAHPGTHGLPVRVLHPFFDVRLAEVVWSTPRYPWRPGKHLLREAMRDRLPAAVLARPKTLLYAARGPADRGDPRYLLARTAEAKLRRGALLSAPGLDAYVDLAAARSLVDAPRPGPETVSFQNAVTLAAWLAESYTTPEKEASHVAGAVA
jgi:asparagine synthase (glutamine-hydrolysing)